jgi:hypothetical protein
MTAMLEGSSIPIAPEDPETGHEGTLPDSVTDPAQWGENYKNMPRKFSKALIELGRNLEQSTSKQRLSQVRRASRRRYFWRGWHYLWWSEMDRRYKVVGIDKVPSDVELPRYDYVTNIYQSYGLAFVAVVSEGKINVRFWPVNHNKQEDLDTAEAASDVAVLIENNNEIDIMAMDEALLNWLDGFVAYHIRYVVDGDEYGVDTFDVLGEPTTEELAPGAMVCPDCGMESPAPPAVESGAPPAPEAPPSSPDGATGGTSGGVPSSPPGQMAPGCPGCGIPLGPDNYRPPVTTLVPNVVGQEDVPRGQEKIELLSRLDVSLPPTANSQKEAAYVTWAAEIHRSRLIETYPWLEKKIRAAGESGAGTNNQGRGVVGGAVDEYFERQARLRARSATDPGIEDEGLVTFRRQWIRPWSFFELAYESEDQKLIRDTLRKAFPTGSFLAYFGDEYCESRDERLDDYWLIAHAMPGEGQDREGVGDSELSVQRRHTTIDNLQIETYEHGVPMLFADSTSVNVKALRGKPAIPGAIYPMQARAGLPAEASIAETRAATVSPQALEHQRALGNEVSQQSTGVYPAVYGGDVGGNDTATGISIQRNQARGRLGLFYRRMKSARAQVMLKAVECFRRNRVDDVDIPMYDDAAKAFKGKTIHLDRLEGAIHARPETEDNFPVSFAEKQAQIFQFLANPVLAPAIATPENSRTLQRFTGLPEIQWPGEASRTKQMREIEQLLEDGLAGRGPIQTAPQMGPMGPMPGPMLPSVMPDEVLDDNVVEGRACQDWANSDAGQLARVQNPPGFLNVKLHAQIHLERAAAAMAAEAMAGAPPGPPGKAPPGKSAKIGPPGASSPGREPPA